MNDQLTVDEWKQFLKARMDQEGGRDAVALPIFDALLSAHPTNPHLLASRAFALQRLGRSQDAVVAKVAADYATTGKALTGSNDTPAAWNAKLAEMLKELETAQDSRARPMAMAAW